MLTRQIHLLELIRQVFQEYNSCQDISNAATQLLNGILQLSESTYGLIVELQDTDPFVIVHAISDSTWDGQARLGYQEKIRLAIGASAENKSALTLFPAKPIIDYSSSETINSLCLPDGQPPITSLLGLPIYSGKTQLGWVGLANSKHKYDQDWVAFLSPFIETCSNLISTTRTRNNPPKDSLKLGDEQTSKDAFITKTGYEMRRLVNGVLGNSQLLLMQDGLDAETQEHLREILQAGTQCTEWINQLLDAATDNTPTKQQKQANPPVPQSQIRPANKKPYRVLVAEDNPANQAVLKMQLNVLGADAQIAKNGYEALAQWHLGGYDLFLVDLKMPGIGGKELTERIRASERDLGGHLPIIANTADHRPETVAACLDLGMDAVLTKPIDLEQLGQALLAWLPQLNTRLNLPQALPSSLSDTNPILDTHYLAQIIGRGEPSQIKTLLDLFIINAREDLSLCRQLLLEKDTSAFTLLIHKLKSSAQTVGALHFASLTKSLESAVNQGNMEIAGDLLTDLEQTLTDVEAIKLDNFHREPEVDESVADLPCCVVVIDPDNNVRQHIKTLLNSLGVTDVMLAKNNSEGLQEITQNDHCVNLLLCDFNMPNLEAIEFLRDISKSRYKGGIILMTASNDDHLLQTAVTFASSQGLYLLGSLTKPFSKNALLALLNQPHGQLTKIVKQLTEQNSASEDILEGLYNNEFEVYFQPKVDAVSLDLVGVEALARWHRQGTVIPAFAFIRAAEQHNLIGELSETLLLKAFLGGARLAAAGYPLTISVNLSEHWLKDINLPDFMKASLYATGLPIEQVILEISERTIFKDFNQAITKLGSLRAKGFKLSIDEFVTGCALQQLMTILPFSELKLDRTFLQRAIDNAGARKMLAGSVEMAAKLNLTIVAEGIETQEDIDLARTLGCDLVQGWFISKAMPVEELIGWLQERQNA